MKEETEVEAVDKTGRPEKPRLICGHIQQLNMQLGHGSWQLETTSCIVFELGLFGRKSKAKYQQHLAQSTHDVFPHAHRCDSSGKVHKVNIN